MVERMLQFVSVPLEMPQKRDADARRRDFAEIYKNSRLNRLSVRPVDAHNVAFPSAPCIVPWGIIYLIG